MILAVDVGNTTIATTLVEPPTEAVATWRAPSTGSHGVVAEALRGVVDEALAMAATRGSTIEDSIFSSVVPGLASVVSDVLATCQGTRDSWPRAAMELRRDLPLPFVVAYQDAATVGLDRLANVAGALVVAPPPVLVVDIGTAGTLEAVVPSNHHLLGGVDSRRGSGLAPEVGLPVFIGGSIWPGLRLMAEALNLGTAALPIVGLESGDGGQPAARAISGSTSGGIRSGVLLAQAGGVDRIIREARRELGSPSTPVFLTGGSATVLSPMLEERHVVEPALTALGLTLILRHARIR